MLTRQSLWYTREAHSPLAVSSIFPVHSAKDSAPPPALSESKRQQQAYPGKQKFGAAMEKKEIGRSETSISRAKKWKNELQIFFTAGYFREIRKSDFLTEDSVTSNK